MALFVIVLAGWRVVVAESANDVYGHLGCILWWRGWQQSRQQSSEYTGFFLPEFDQPLDAAKLVIRLLNAILERHSDSVPGTFGPAPGLAQLPGRNCPR